MGATVKGTLVPLLLLVLVVWGLPGAAQVESQPGPALAVLVHHPYPDAADPLGVGAPFAANGSLDAFVGRYQRYDTGRDGFGYPSLVVDGVVPIEGLPDGDAPYVATRGAYEAALAQRSDGAVPLALEVASRFDGDRVMAQITVLPAADLAGEDLHVWVALSEDHVFYEPPPALSNGVTNHRFTVRAVRDLGSLADLDAAGTGAMAPRQAGVVLVADGAWDREQLYVTAWVQQGAGHGLRFEPLEVVQATTHRAMDSVPTRQDAKGVLLELYSATWCGPCLYGDTVVEEMAQERGHAAYLSTPSTGAQYWQEPERMGWAIAGALAGAWFAARAGPGRGAA